MPTTRFDGIRVQVIAAAKVQIIDKLDTGSEAFGMVSARLKVV